MKQEILHQRRYHGFGLLVAHLEALSRQGRHRARLHLIKEVVELRPIYHHADAEVRAHVTLCVLALLLQRVMEGRLAAAGGP